MKGFLRTLKNKKGQLIDNFFKYMKWKMQFITIKYEPFRKIKCKGELIGIKNQQIT